MSRLLNEKEIQAILSLNGRKRYNYFIKFVSDMEKVWGLYQDGWALVSDENSSVKFPLWPAKEYASLCSTNEWTSYKPKSINMDEFIDTLIPLLLKDHIGIAIFPTPESKGVIVDCTELKGDLDRELSRYE